MNPSATASAATAAGKASVSQAFEGLGLFHLVAGLVVVLVSIFAAKLLARQLRRVMQNRIERDHAELIVKITSYGFVTVAVISSLKVLGVDLSGLLVAGGMVGLVVGFASQRIVANLISGIFLILERPIRIGSEVALGDTTGVVEDIRIMSTILRTYDGVYVRIPNEKVFTSDITNLVANAARRFDCRVSIRYEDDVPRALEILRAVIAREPLALVEPEPLVFVEALGDNGVEILARVWAPTAEWYPLKRALLPRMKQALEAAGLQIPFPQRVLWWGGGAGSPASEGGGGGAAEPS